MTAAAHLIAAVLWGIATFCALLTIAAAMLDAAAPGVASRGTIPRMAAMAAAAVAVAMWWSR